MIFTTDERINGSMTIVDVQPLLVIYNGQLKPSKNALLFGFRENVSCGMFFIDENYIWYCEYDKKIAFKLFEK